MDRMLVVVFDNEGKAYEGQQALLQLANEGNVSLYAYAVLVKNADGSAKVKQEDDTGPLATLAGTAFGSLIGLLGGPAGMAVGYMAGALGGSAADLNNARIGYDFIDDVNKSLLPSRAAVVAEVEEEWTTPLDTRMEAIGGRVFRRALSDVKVTANAEDVDAMKADFSQMRTELAKAQDDRKAKLTEKMDQLDAKIQAQMQRNKDRRLTLEREARAKAEMLKARVAAPKAKAS